MLRFLTDPGVRFAKNLSERDGRMLKPRQESSGGFHFMDATNDFVAICPVPPIARKRYRNRLPALTGEPARLFAGIRVA